MIETQLSFFDLLNEQKNNITETSEELEALKNPLDNSIPMTSTSFFCPDLVVGEETLLDLKVDTCKGLFTEIAFDTVGYYQLPIGAANDVGYLIYRGSDIKIAKVYKSLNHFYTLPEEEFKFITITQNNMNEQLSSIILKDFITILVERDYL